MCMKSKKNYAGKDTHGNKYYINTHARKLILLDNRLG